MAKLSKEQHAEALRGQEFLNTISRKASELKLEPHMAVRYFGLFTKRLVDNLVADGVPKDNAVKGAFELFCQGLGVNMVDVDSEPLQ